MKMKFIWGIFLLLVLSTVTHLQAQVVVKAGITNQQDNTWRELLAGYGFVLSQGYTENFFGESSVTLGIAAGVESDDNELSPKLSIGLNTGGLLSLTSSLNLNYYQEREQKMGLTPEIGVAFIKVLHVTYGYQFNSTRKGGREGSPHRISFFLTIPLTRNTK